VQHLAWLLLVSAATFAACGGPSPPFRPVVDTKLLMQSVVDPNADVIWETVKTIDMSAPTAIVSTWTLS
jgi:hypothetical protein